MKFCPTETHLDVELHASMTRSTLTDDYQLRVVAYHKVDGQRRGWVVILKNRITGKTLKKWSEQNFREEFAALAKHAVETLWNKVS